MEAYTHRFVIGPFSKYFHLSGKTGSIFVNKHQQHFSKGAGDSRLTQGIAILSLFERLTQSFILVISVYRYLTLKRCFPQSSCCLSWISRRSQSTRLTHYNPYIARRTFHQISPGTTSLCVSLSFTSVSLVPICEIRSLFLRHYSYLYVLLFPKENWTSLRHPCSLLIPMNTVCQII